MYCWEAAGLLAVMMLAGCAINAPSESTPPQYLLGEIQKHAPVAKGLTAYPINGPFGADITRFARLGRSNVIAGTRQGEIFRSEDAGANWTLVNAQSLGTVNDLALVNNLIFAGTDGGLFRSADGGISWNRVQVVSDYPLFSVHKLLMFREQLLAATSNGLFRSDPGGQSWSEIVPTSAPPDPQIDFTKVGFPSPVLMATGGGKVLVSDGTYLLSSDDLRSWQEAGQGLRLGVEYPDGEFEHSKLSNLINVGDVIFSTRIDKNGTSLYRKTSQGEWAKVQEVKTKPLLKARVMDDSLFLITADGVRGLNHDESLELGTPERGLAVNDIVKLGDSVLAATARGAYVRNGATGVWTASTSGMRGSRRLGPLVMVNTFRFAVLDGNLFRSKEGDENWTSMSQDFSRQGLNSTERVPTVVDLASFGSWLFVTTDKGLYRCKVDGGELIRPPPPKDDQSDDFGTSGLLVATNEYLFVSTKSRTFRTGDGETWEELSANFRDLAKIVAFASAGNSLFLSKQSQSPYTPPLLIRLAKDKNRWEEVNTGTQAPVTAFGTAGDTVYAAASLPGSGISADKLRPQLFRLEHVTDSTWEPLKAVGLTGEVRSFWIYPRQPEVILAGTTAGLFWSNDGGQQFNKTAVQPGASFSRVGSFAYKKGQLLANTDTGVFYIYDQIPRGKWYVAWIERIEQNAWLFSGTALVVILLVVLSTRLISLLLQLDVFGINQIAPAFYLLPFGQWKLYRRYRARLRNAEGLAEDLKYGVEHYVNTPFEVDGELIEGPLSEFFTLQPIAKRIILDADGGRGKSALCHYLAHRCVNEQDLFGGKRLVPVVIDGLSYTGDLLSAISNALTEDHAYVNKTIVASQISAGYLLVIFDGFSEIKESYLEAASSKDLPEFIKQHPDTPFIFTSRSKLPPGVRQALKDTITINLRDVDETTERVFLSQYLKRGEKDVDTLMSEIKTRFNDLPRIPLMLKLIATVYDKKAKVPKDRAMLFADYAEQVLRPDATGIDYPRGLHFAIRHLVRESYLRSGGDRGFTEDRAVDLLWGIKDQLEAREINLSPIRLLQLLTRAGLYKQVGENLKFFHDSFESYFGARALENDFRDKQYAMIKECAGNLRLAETWRFLSEILEETGEKGELDSLARESLEELYKSAYLESQRDRGVDYYLQLSGKGNSYAGEMQSAEGRQSIHIKLSPDSLATLGRDLRLEMGRLSQVLGASGAKTRLAHDEYLPHMARLGNYAFKQIFANTGLLDIISKLRPPSQNGSIQIASDLFFFPWELIYPVELNDALSYQYFWGMNHIISHLIIQEPRPDLMEGATAPHNRPKVGLLADERIDHVAKEEISFFSAMQGLGRIDLHVFAPTPSQDRRSSVHQVRAFLADNFDIIHFACNVSYNKSTPDDSTIDLGHDWQLKLSDIEFYDFAINGNPLIVMNTCESGNLDALKVSGFAPTFLKRGARGVVATESTIPVTTAGTFTELLYERLLAGDPLGQSLLAVRRALWENDQNPAGLLYSMYAPPSLLV